MSSPIIIGVDPGPTHSAAVLLEERLPIIQMYKENIVFKSTTFDVIWKFLTQANISNIYVVIEQVKHYGSGMPVGASVFDTVLWTGRFIEAWHDISERLTIEQAPRSTIKTQICGTAKAKDSNVRQALIDRFPATGGGATPQIGIKSKRGPLYGIMHSGVKGASEHLWSALAVAVYKHETMEK